MFVVICISTGQCPFRRKTVTTPETSANRPLGMCHVGIHGNGVVPLGSYSGYVTKCGHLYFTVFKSEANNFV